jgi:hypothetical protein
VDSVLLDLPLSHQFTIEPLFSLGLRGWELVAVVPKTIGIVLKNTSYGASAGTTWGAGVGGNVTGAHFILRKSLSASDIQEDDVKHAIAEQVSQSVASQLASNPNT